MIGENLIWLLVRGRGVVGNLLSPAPNEKINANLILNEITRIFVGGTISPTSTWEVRKGC